MYSSIEPGISLTKVLLEIEIVGIWNWTEENLEPEIFTTCGPAD
jgi:hypothetical protein